MADLAAASAAAAAGTGSMAAASMDADSPAAGSYVGHGQRGTVSVAAEACPRTGASRMVATKRRREGAPSHAIGREAEFLALVNRHGIGPRLVALADDGEAVSYEYVKGLPILDHCQQTCVGRAQVLHILEQIFAQLLLLDRLRLNKHEMTWPAEHILIEAATVVTAAAAAAAAGDAGAGADGAGDGGAGRSADADGWRPVMIDFERCTANAAKPRNITQFLQFLATPTVAHLLRLKGIAVDVPRLRRFGSQYKARLVAMEEEQQAAACAVVSTGLGPDEVVVEVGGMVWDFIGDLGLRDDPSDAEQVEAASFAVSGSGAAGSQAAPGGGGRAARKLETKRARAEAEARAVAAAVAAATDAAVPGGNVAA